MPLSVSHPVRGYGGVYRFRVVVALLAIVLTMLLGGRARAGFINGGFEEGTFNGWTLEHGVNTGGTILFSPGSDGHAYIIGTSQSDPYSPFDDPFFGSYMGRMNEPSPDADATRISQTATMLPGETDLYVSWGTVLQDAGHDPPDQPFFRIEIEKNGEVVASESFNVDYLILHGLSSAAGFYYDSGNFHLSGFVPGDVVKVTLTAADCSATGHSGYAYLDGIGTVPSPQEIGVSESETNLVSGSEVSYDQEFLGNDGIKRTFIIQNYGTQPLENLTATITGPGAGNFIATPLPTDVLAGGQRTTFDVTFRPLTTGEQQATLHITSNDADEPTFDISLAGTGSDAMQAFFLVPSSVPYSRSSFSATGITLLQPTLGFTPLPDAILTLVENTGTLPVTGTFTGLPEGSIVEVLRNSQPWRFQLSYAAGTGNDVELILVEPDITILPEELSPPYLSGQSTEHFGGVLTGTPVVRNFVAGNPGNGPLTGISATIEGPHAADFAAAGLGTSLAIDDTAPFTVTFTPQAAGIRTATLVIHSDDPDEAEFRIALTGEGHVALPVAIDQPAWTLTDAGQVPWIGQAVVTHDDTHAGRSGTVTDGESSTMETVVEGPGTLSFWWKVSSEAGYDFLEFSVDGSVQKNRISGETGWEQRTFTIPTGTHTLRWSYVKDAAFAAGADTGWVDQIVWTSSPVTLAEAVDQPAWTLANAGDTPWLGQTTVSHDGADAGHSGPVTDGGSSTMDTVVEGPGTLSFWWKVSSEAGYDFLEFTVDGTAQKIRISGETGWEQRSLAIPAGSHTLSWRYTKDGDTAAGADAGWVDQIVWSTTPILLAEAVDQTSWSFTNSAHLPWTGQDVVTHDGTDAGRSGLITHGQASTMDAVVQGPVTISFWWKVSSETDFDYLEFTVDGTAQKVRISGEVDWHQRTHTIGAGTHTLSWRYVKDGNTSAGADAGWLDQLTWSTASVPLADALDQPEWIFTDAGQAPWLGQTAITHDEIDAARSGPVANGESSTMNTVVEGPITLSFWWKVSSEANADFLEFTVNGTAQKTRISGETGWEKKTYALGEGTHDLSWRYFKDATAAVGTDAGWVDRITLTEPGETDDAYTLWAANYFTFSELANPLISGPNADPNRDGVVNLLHFAFNLGPYANGNVILHPDTGTAGLPAFRVANLGGQRLVLEYIRRKASSDPGITYTPQFSANLSSWQNASAMESVQSIDATWERVTIQDHNAGNAVRFGRLQVLSVPLGP